MKEIEYMGGLLSVPEWTKFLAMDRNGYIFAYGEKPIKHSKSYNVDILKSTDFMRYQYIATLKNKSKSIALWGNSLMEVK